jgi:hypothetical protein
MQNDVIPCNVNFLGHEIFDQAVGSPLKCEHLDLFREHKFGLGSAYREDGRSGIVVVEI